MHQIYRPGSICRLLFLLAGLCGAGAKAATYYVDPVGGNNSNSGTATNSAWQTLAKVNATTFVAGDSILFKAGGVWSGTTQLHPLGSGTSGNPIIIDMYGTGPKPLIDAGSATGNGAVYLANQSYWEINNLEITSNDTTDGDRRGVHILNSTAGTTLNHVYIKNCYIHNIRGTIGATDADLTAKRTGGIVVESTSTTAKYNDILIEGNTIADVRNQGIVACINGNGGGTLNNEYPGTTAWNNMKCTSVVIRGNSVSGVYKNAMIIRNTDETGLVEHNVCHNTAISTTGNTMFTSSCRGTVFQYNEGYANQAGDHDGSMYDADLRSPSIVFQYSYSHDNTHGLFWTYPSGNTEPNDNVVVRYNISQNDQGDIFAFSGTGLGSSAEIYNNTVYISSTNPPPTNPPQKIFEDRQNDHTYTVKNNIFYILNPTAIYSFGTSTRTFDYNVFYGQHPASEPANGHKLTSDPLLFAPGTGANGITTLTGYKLQTGSPCIDSGTTVANNGGFDFFGNAVPYNGTTDRGAYEWTPAPPTIIRQPTNMTILVGAGAGFSVAADGPTPLRYQWRKNGVAVSGATNTSLNFAVTTTNDSAGYTVVVTNNYGAVTSSIAVLAVVNPGNYINTRFVGVTTNSGINFTTVTNFYGAVQNLALDVYQPAGDTSTNRPVIMWIHGGGFRTGSTRTQSYIVNYANEFALRGYVCISIDYRLRNGTDMPNDDYELPAQQDAAHDANTALAWIRANAATYQINTNWMFIGGGSAGGRVTCVLGFHEGPDTNLCSCASAPTNNVPNNTYPFTDWNRGGVIALADLWGSPEVPKRWYTLDSNDVPVTIIHGTADGTIDFTNSIALANGLISAGVNYYLNPIAGADHTPTAYDSSIIPWMANFFAREWTRKLSGTTGVDAVPLAATSIGTNTATLNAIFLSLGAPTSFYFKYGPTTNYGSTTATNPVAAVAATTNVSAAISGLFGSTLYHYSVVISNAAGTQASPDATFTTLSFSGPPVITMQPQSVTTNAGSAVTFSATAGGTGPLRYQWRKALTPILNETNTILILSAVSTNDANSFDVVVTNALGTVTSSPVTLSVTVGSSISGGKMVIAEVYNFGGKSNATYNRDYVLLKNIGNSSVTISNWSLQHDKASVWQAPFALPITNIPPGGYFLVRCYYDGGASSGASFTYDATTPLASAWNLAGGSAGAVALVSDTNILTSCSSASIVDLVGYVSTSANCYEGTGVAPGGSLTQSNQRFVNGCQDTGDNGADFTVGTPNPRNSSSPAESCCVFPVIAAQPVSQSVAVGDSVSFSIAGYGSAPLPFQWRKAGTKISGATASSLSLTVTSAGDAGDYDVVITNSCGAVTSSVATLTVGKGVATIAITSPQNPAGYLTNLTFNATVTGGAATPTGTVQFMTNNSAFGGAVSLVGGSIASVGTTALPRGTNTITAEYSGDANYFSATNTLLQVVTNHPPVAAPVSFIRKLALPCQIPLVSLTNSWSDADGDPVTIAGFDLTSTNGVVYSTNATTIFYSNPNPVTDRLNYTVRDTYGDVAPGFIVITSWTNSVGHAISLNFNNPGATVRFSAVPGWIYDVQRSTNLTSWRLIDTVTAPTNGLFDVYDDFSDLGTTPSPGFYRLITQ